VNITKFGGRVNNKGVRSISADSEGHDDQVVAIAPTGQEMPPITLVFKRCHPSTRAQRITITRWHWGTRTGFWIFLAA
jgi:hypothetical protein